MSSQQSVVSGQRSASSIQYPASSIQNLASSIQYPASSIQHPALDIVSFRNGALSVFIIWCVLISLSGCLVEGEPTVVSGSTPEADNALKEAEAQLEAAGFTVSLDDPGDLTHPEDLIPDPGDLGDPEDQASFEESIVQLNIVLAELEQETEDGLLGSVSDRGLVHLYLGFAYYFDAISRLLLSDDPEETFIIGSNAADPDSSWYTFGVSLAVQKGLDDTEDPLEYPLVFTVKERQAIIDAADLIDDAVVKPKESSIQPQFSSVDRPPYTRSASWHFQKSAELFGQYSTEIMDALDAFNETLEDVRDILQEKAEEWGFIYIPPIGNN